MKWLNVWKYDVAYFFSGGIQVQYVFIERILQIRFDTNNHPKSFNSERENQIETVLGNILL